MIDPVILVELAIIACLTYFILTQETLSKDKRTLAEFLEERK